MVRVTRNEAAARLKVSKSPGRAGHRDRATRPTAHRLDPMDGLVDLFDLVEKMEFERLPQMADCSARRALDDRLSSTRAS